MSRPIVNTELVERLSEINIIEDSNELEIEIVHEALERLSEREADIVGRLLLEGEALVDVAEDYGLPPSKVKKIRDDAVEKLKQQIELSCQYRGVGPIYNDCILCGRDETEDINLFINDWLEETNWKLRGLPTAIMDRFDVKYVTSKVLEFHIKHHLRGAMKIVEPEDQDNYQVFLRIPGKIRQRVILLADKWDVSRNAVYKILIKRGLETIPEVQKNSALFVELVKKEMR